MGVLRGQDRCGRVHRYSLSCCTHLEREIKLKDLAQVQYEPSPD
jgi:hypothetical protein